VEAKYVQSPEYHEAWKVQARDVLARAEFRKRKLTQRVSTMQWAYDRFEHVAFGWLQAEPKPTKFS